MARLIRAPVEFKSCECGYKYLGSVCPTCGLLYEPTRTSLSICDRFIVVDTDPEQYQRISRCRCTQCTNLFPLPTGGELFDSRPALRAPNLYLG